MLPVVAITLIVFGIVFVLSSIEVKKIQVIDSDLSSSDKKNKGQSFSKGEISGNSIKGDGHSIGGYDRGVIEVESHRSSNDIKSLPPVSDREKNESDRATVEKKSVVYLGETLRSDDGEKRLSTPKVEPEVRDENEFQVVFYEGDKSYFQNGDGPISVDLIKKCKRIGSGKLNLQSDSLTYRVEKRVYRFDFNKIEFIFGEGAYVMIFLYGYNVASLFISESNEEISKQILRAYSAFQSNNK